MKRLLTIAAGLVGLIVLAAIVRITIGRVAPRMMEAMAEHVMPRMMDRCFGSMSAERREFMLTHCRGMLDRIDDKYAVSGQASAATN